MEFVGAEVGRPIDLTMTVDRTLIGTGQELMLIRDGKERSVSVVLEEMPLQCMRSCMRNGGQPLNQGGTVLIQRLVHHFLRIQSNGF